MTELERLQALHKSDQACLRELAAEIDRLRALNAEMRQWLKACLNIVEGDGFPPSWDGIRAILAKSDASS